MGFFSMGLKNEFETAVVNEPSVFEPLKFYCIYNVCCEMKKSPWSQQLSLWQNKLYWLQSKYIGFDPNIMFY